MGVAGPPPRAWGWLRTPPTGRRWWLRPPPCEQTHFFIFFFFFFFGLLGWPDHPQGHGGGFGHPIPAVGGGWSHPRFPPFFFFFNFPSFFQQKKKKKKKLKWPKLLYLKWSKLRRFGQNGVVLE
jgi:hypothetical protein